MKIRSEFTCPLELTLDMISGKWKPIIIWRLRLGKQQLSTLNKDIQGINQKMLIQHLSELIECGIVEKITYLGYPLKVEYFLTEIGFKFLGGLEVFQEIGQEYFNQNQGAVLPKEVII
ncbi:helix-turn-helix domain-containing protein [Pelosinus sp. IPA-1]|uniref:winged helix-turn-helix transcriptional regulator n=1 Tax=Pelosinus sp. IPA-1 TaxID=3029569 RepID=UPI0024362647|nr:helix-turn-helix domain-containing protein [Pelosinus sp. IPA-1]GMA97715.1 transcriptional regulator [Pelosinus sp. IPA-1]